MSSATIQSGPKLTPGTARHNPNVVPTAPKPTHEAIAALAYDIYISTGRAAGRSEQNWLQAEQDLTRRAAAAFEAKRFMDGLSYNG